MASGTTRQIDITGLTADSRAVREGYLFAAIPGTRADGRQFIADAVANGARAVLAPEDTQLDAGVNATLVEATDVRSAFARMAAAFYGRQPAFIAAVTGTNGKTSVATFARQLWTRAGEQAASVGTLGLVPEIADSPGKLTTPDPEALHRCLAQLADQGVHRLAIEASSHGLDQARLDGLQVSAAAFTNLTQDHLDYHGTLDAYLAAKLRLFSHLLQDGGTAVVNADSQHAGAVLEACRTRNLTVWTYGEAKTSDIRLAARQPTLAGQHLELDLFGDSARVQLPLVGKFQAMNALAALGLVLASGLDRDAALAGMAALEGVPGRLQRVAETPSGGQVFVDYAHTPDALETVLQALRPHVGRRLICIFGCGGDRDRGKRPIMGEIAARLAEEAIVTDDNPRSEDPAAIRQEILAAAPDSREVDDRARAIREAIAEMDDGDLLLIAGKGHETGQIVGDQTLPFDDAEVARAAIAQLKAGHP
ncbi:UDP-N-acetylmuramoyl-L-alanyl-D-glutamate--2,6-diaminopimelate ligase [Rhodovibrio salinarum]|uniref:UDP-N-acetylmuramoyl-L-alanyl-D-glutamate--2,6-diaminopimelate ligase n=2 Tax=Rhodovibrio salinarum TaxID=1087 RepID=A0A934QH98_9PROT|nr:UDP-N-acetylmuramoyl-L-alanyl-D-glutamate--2,6-diaminopimelate ligase [Rhodovibrio salinarum]MBK1696495.1 UDP-N-acetylmuramoyl-L-alanyl-D-glutamate--2,6-diaminopimelate ligase [Rhodovibrio salinarum]